jgi:hypothetical protein
MAFDRKAYMKAYNKAYYQEYREGIREAQEQYARSRKDERAAYNKRYDQEHPEKLIARNAVAYALETGTLKRLPCEVCGSILTEAHHEDYSKPLEVEWLCNLHHAERRGDAS